MRSVYSYSSRRLSKTWQTHWYATNEFKYAIFVSIMHVINNIWCRFTMLSNECGNSLIYFILKANIYYQILLHMLSYYGLLNTLWSWQQHICFINMLKCCVSDNICSYTLLVNKATNTNYFYVSSPHSFMINDNYPTATPNFT